MRDKKSGEKAVKEYLQQIRYQKMRVTHLSERLEEFYVRLYSVRSPTVDRAPTRKDHAEWFSDLLHEKDLTERQLVQEIERLIDIRVKIWGQITTLENPLFREVLFLRYDQFFSLEKIAEETGKSRAWIYEVHGAALKEFAIKNFPKNE